MGRSPLHRKRRLGKVELTGFASAGSRPARRDRQQRSGQPNHVWVYSSTPPICILASDTFLLLRGTPTCFLKALGMKKTRGEDRQVTVRALSGTEMVPETRETIRGPAVIQLAQISFPAFTPRFE